jgi:quinol monooxygenase YgiN
MLSSRYCTMHHVLARITAKPEAAEATRGILSELAVKSRTESGCVAYELYQQEAAPHVFQTVECWKSRADADAHMTTPHLAAAVAAAGPLLAAPPEILAWTKLE